MREYRLGLAERERLVQQGQLSRQGLGLRLEQEQLQGQDLVY